MFFIHANPTAERLINKTVAQKMPEDWIVKSSGNGAVRLNLQDNQAVFEADFEIDREEIDALRFAKRIERDEEIDGSQSANDARGE